MMIFGTAGVPLCTIKRESVEGIKEVRALGLDAFEFEFVHGVRMKPDLAKQCGGEAKKLNVSLSAHAPYYINLIGEEQTRKNSRRMILETCAALEQAGGGRAVIHSGFYQKMEKVTAFEHMVSQYEIIIEEMKENKWEKAILAPEITGKHSAFGDVSELYSLAKHFGLGKLNPTIDFAHLHARSNGSLKEKGDYLKILNQVEELAGKKALQSLHIHFTGIAYGEKGEKHHLEISSNSPPFKPLAEALVELKCSGTIISESPNIEKDALIMQDVYQSLSK